MSRKQKCWEKQANIHAMHQTEHQRMSHSVQVILILCLSTLHQRASGENENLTFVTTDNYNHTEFVSGGLQKLTSRQIKTWRKIKKGHFGIKTN